MNLGTVRYNSLNCLHGLIPRLRHLFFTNLYLNNHIIIEFMEIIRSIVDPISIEFSPNDYSFCIKIKKSIMKKGISPDKVLLFAYENYIKEIFSQFITSHRQEIEIMMHNSGLSNDPRNDITALLTDKSQLVNMCNVTCLSNNILIIKL